MSNFGIFLYSDNIEEILIRMNESFSWWMISMSFLISSILSSGYLIIITIRKIIVNIYLCELTRLESDCSKVIKKSRRCPFILASLSLVIMFGTSSSIAAFGFLLRLSVLLLSSSCTNQFWQSFNIKLVYCWAFILPELLGCILPMHVFSKLQPCFPGVSFHKTSINTYYDLQKPINQHQ